MKKYVDTWRNKKGVQKLYNVFPPVQECLWKF